MNIIEAETSSARAIKMVLLCILAIVCSPVLLILGWYRLRNIPEDDPNHKFLKYILIYGVVLMVGLFGYLIWKFSPDSGENKTNVTWLPDLAVNISYYRQPFDCEIFEFDVNEENFKKIYIHEKLQEITEPITIKRYTAKIENSDPETHSVTVSGGMFAEGPIKSLSGKYYRKVVFDRTHGRAYVCSEVQ